VSVQNLFDMRGAARILERENPRIHALYALVAVIVIVMKMFLHVVAFILTIFAVLLLWADRTVVAGIGIGAVLGLYVVVSFVIGKYTAE
jgi:hypothetical protein